jgi:hypothetical protein
MPMIVRTQIGAIADAASTRSRGDTSTGDVSVLKVDTDSGPTAGLVILTPQK